MYSVSKECALTVCAPCERSVGSFKQCYHITYYVGYPLRIYLKIKNIYSVPLYFLLKYCCCRSSSVMIFPIVLWKISISTHRTLDSVAVDHAAVYNWMIFMRFHRVYQMLLGRPCQLLRRSFFSFFCAPYPPTPTGPFRLFSRLNSSEFLSSCFCVSALQVIQIPTLSRKRLRACKDHGAHNVPHHRPNPNTHPDTTCTHPSPFSTCLY